MPRDEIPCHRDNLAELRHNMATIEAVLRRWPSVRLSGLTTHLGLMAAWEIWESARGHVHVRGDDAAELRDLVGWLLSDGGRLRRPHESRPWAGWRVLWHGWCFYTDLEESPTPTATAPGGPPFHDFPTRPGAQACSRPGCAAHRRLPSGRTPCPLPARLAEALDQDRTGKTPERAA